MLFTLFFRFIELCYSSLLNEICFPSSVQGVYFTAIRMKCVLIYCLLPQVIGSESIDEEDQGSQISRFLEGYREGRTEQKKVAGPSIFGFVNSLIGIRSVYIIVFMVAMLMLLRTLGKDDEEPPRVGTSDQSEHARSTVSRAENDEYRSGEKED